MLNDEVWKIIDIKMEIKPLPFKEVKRLMFG
jgi:hypothetical protein